MMAYMQCGRPGEWMWCPWPWLWQWGLKENDVGDVCRFFGPVAVFVVTREGK